MEKSKYRYYLRRKNGSNYDWFTVSGGSVTYTTSASPVNPLSKKPSGWNDNMVNFERKFPQVGIVKSYTVPLRFVKDGAKIVRYIALTYGTEAKLELYIEKFNSTLAVNGYEYFYSGELNLIGEESDKDYDTLECYEGGFLAKFAARQSSTYELELDTAPDKIWVRLHPCKLRSRLKWVGAQGTVVDEDFNGHGVPILSPMETEGTNIYFETFDQQFTNPIQFIENQDSNPHDITLTFTYDYYCTNLSAGNAYFEIGYQVYDTTNNNTISHNTVYQDPTAIPASSSAWRQGTQSTTITIGVNRGIYIEVRMKDGGGTNLPNVEKTMTQGNSNSVEFETEVYTEEIFFAARRLNSVFEELIDKVSDGETVGESTLLSSTYSNYYISSGDAIRNLWYAKLKMSPDDFIESIDSIFSCCTYFDRTTNKFKLESKATAFQDTQIMNLGEVSNFKRRPFTQEMFNTLRCGYPEQTYDNVNGKDEPNKAVVRLSPVVRVKTDKDVTSKFRADRTGAILVGLNLVGKKFADANTDNDIWVFRVNPSVAGTIPATYTQYGGGNIGENYYSLYIDPTLTITNVYDSDNLFNVDLSPTRNILRNGPWYRSILDYLDSGKLKFQTSDKTAATNTEMETFDGVTTINEGDDIVIGDLGDKYFRAQIFEFETKVNFDLNAVMTANPFGYAKFTTEGKELKAFIIKCGEDPTKNLAQTFITLSHPDNDLTQLIF